MSGKLTGKIFYASKDAQAKRYYFEGRKITTNSYHSVYEIEPGFVEVNFDSSGTNYIHLTLTNKKGII